MAEIRLRKKRSSNIRRGTITKASTIVLVVGSSVVGLALLLLLLMLGFRQPGQASSMSRGQRFQFLRSTASLQKDSLIDNDDYPGTFVDLWPDDTQNTAFANVLWDCVPDASAVEESPCQVRYKKKDDDHDNNNNNKIQRVAIARPPGRLGTVFVHYIQRLVENHPTEGKYIELIPTNHIIDLEHDYSNIIRFVALPVLLEAADLTLVAMANDDDDDNKVNIRLEDLESVAAQLVRWHCHWSQNTADTALITITLDRMMGYPAATTKQLQAFLGLTPYDNAKQNRVPGMDDMALIVMDIIQEASALVASIEIEQQPTITSNISDISHNNNPIIQQRINQRVEMEVAASQNNEECQDVNQLLSNEAAFSISDSVQRIGQFLSPDTSLSDAFCQEHKNSLLCQV